MRLARVVGTCVATQKVDALVGQRLLLIQPVEFDLESAGPHIIAVDVVRADRGQLVWYVGSREAANSLANKFTPVDTAVVGIVDELVMADAGGEQRP